MTERINLREDDFTIIELGESFNHTFAYLKLYANNPIHLTDIRKLRSKILEDQEKAKWWDKTYAEIVTDECEINDNAMAFFCLQEDTKKLYELEQEIKTLKEELAKK